MTKAATTGAGLTTVVLAAAAWVIAVRQMNGMDMGVATELGFLASFVGYSVPMMLPGAAPAVFARARMQAVPLFVGSYLAVWTPVRPCGLRVVPAA